LWNNYKFKIIGKYTNVSTPTNIETEDGYRIFCTINSLKQNKNLRTKFFNKRNLYTIYNIKLWCKLNNKSFELVSNTYINCSTRLEWRCLIDNKIFNKCWTYMYKDERCPYCTGQKIGLSNCLATTHPEITQQWHPTKNGDLTPYDVTWGTHKKAWWICEKGHEWYANISSRTRKINGSCCPICINQQILIGYNDMWTTNPEYARFLANSEDGYKYTQYSHSKVNWICPECKNLIENKIISNVTRHGLSCPKCSDGISYSEKFMYSLLDQLVYNLDINFKYQKSDFKWAMGKIYDFFIINNNAIVETHGKQHYEENGFNFYGGRTLEEEQENDKIKEELAINNNIINYIVIDCKKSELEYIKNNILNSKLAKLYDLSNIDWLKCHEFACNSLIKIVCDLWNSGLKSTTEISDKMHISVSTIRKYLKQGTLLNWCDYPKGKIRFTNNKPPINSRSVINLNTNKIFDSIINAAKYYNMNSYGNISFACQNKTKTAGGYIWMYYDEYIKLSQDEIDKLINIKLSPSKRKQKVINLNTKKVFNSITEASIFYNISIDTISSACLGRQKTAGNYLWLYYDDYLKLFQKEIDDILNKQYKYKVINIDTNQIFNSIKDAVKFYNYNHNHIGDVCRGKLKTSGGYRWMYYNDYLKLNENYFKKPI